MRRTCLASDILKAHVADVGGVGGAQSCRRLLSDRLSVRGAYTSRVSVRLHVSSVNAVLGTI